MTFSFHRIPVGICNCFLLRGEQTILVDGGAMGGLPAFKRILTELHIEPGEIELILLTHGHWDHITCLDDIQRMTGAKIAIHEKDRFMVETGEPPFPNGVNGYGKAMSALAKGILHPHLPKLKVDTVIPDAGMSLRAFGIPGEVIYTPGHSMGHVSIVLDTGDALVGDMAMNDWYLRLSPGLPILADDIRLVVESWKKILPLGIKRVYPAHGLDFPVEVMQKEIANFK
ncbi:MAG TPA: MBL fold metallo-hydrolase [Anaerolineales bacterium]|nr:MBL fold metallo-hydrolase [Anaerolineales bacterium]HRK90352.1 MBL fold metallo-hydrolase [Anaerolineales bacterium]